MSQSHDQIGLGTSDLPRSGVIVNKGAYTVTFTSDVISLQQSGVDDLILVINFVKTGAAPSVTFAIQGVTRDDQGAKIVWPILTSAAVVATGVVVLRVSDSMTAIANLVAQDITPDFFQVVCTHGNTDVATYSITAIAAG